jgi:hypothetical protein
LHRVQTLARLTRSCRGRSALATGSIVQLSRVLVPSFFLGGCIRGV